MSSMTLIRGVPGSGKTTHAHSLARGMKHPYHVEADMYFEDEDGNYNFSPILLSHAHKWCQERAREMYEAGYDVIVSNTFTRRWEMEPYFQMAGGPENCRIYRCMGRFYNIHGVPEKAINRMLDRFEPHEGEIHVFANAEAF